MKQEFIIEACSGKSIIVEKNQTITVIDIEGGQVVDFFAEVYQKPDEFLSTGVTIDCNESLRLTLDSIIYTNLYNPMFQIIMGNAISVVIALVGILNFINSMVTAIVSRKKEFAMLQSVGMTKGQLRRMLVFEGLDYAGLTLLFSFAASILVVGTVVRSMVEGGYNTFQFTLLPLYICAPILIAFAIVIPYICFKNLEKQSLVERLRNTD